jgi:uncharacterized protein
MTLQEVTDQKSDIIGIFRNYPVSNPRLFGSTVRGESTSKSDIDFLVRTEPGCSLLHLGGLLCDLEDLLGCRVDLVTEDGLRPQIRDRVLREAIQL